MADHARHERLRQDLQVAITDVYPTAGTLIVVHPKADVQFTPEYADWLAAELRKLLPAGVRAMILSQNVTEFAAVQPPDGESGDYIRGWQAAVEAITEELRL